MEKKLNIDGLTLIQNNGDVQEVKHFHLHLKPYYNNGKSMSVEDVYNLLK
jgi:diadenosine tetraphosphate (Ap4A) HIT family hydrolase